MNIGDQVRQGDLLIERIKELPADVKPLPHRILAEGEATGHVHALDAGILYEKGGLLFFNVEKAKATLTHQEHAAHEFPPGTYQVTRQREWVEGEVQQVAD